MIWLREVGEKAVNQLEKSVNSKLEDTVSRQIEAQFQTLGKQALQLIQNLKILYPGKSRRSFKHRDALKSSTEASIVPAFEKSCIAMFEQVDATFQKGMVEHATVAQQHYESALSPLAHALREAISSASSVTQTLSGELADGQRDAADVLTFLRKFDVSIGMRLEVLEFTRKLQNLEFSKLHQLISISLFARFTGNLRRSKSTWLYQETASVSI
ncbi:hypothetical protein RchiOBHm_Chr4g0386801 [Rosa chinensis]|uniref:Uncharacterized protein n=1 Tax=Rosa chinensis TaxID=74649 RepID=A0A2P6QPA3_ROSCH|nr:hypothetical protein RchiOBHm_Chr4g0386801 [Rosa chinensis]